MTTERLEDDEVVVECALDQPPDKVWRALTEPDLLAAWLTENDFRPEEGARCTFAPVDPSAPEGEVACEVLELDPERLMRLAWRGAEDRRDANGDRLDSVVSFELQPMDDGRTFLRVVHAGLAARTVAASNVLPFRRRMPTQAQALRMAA